MIIFWESEYFFKLTINIRGFDIWQHQDVDLYYAKLLKVESSLKRYEYVLGVDFGLRPCGGETLFRV